MKTHSRILRGYNNNRFSIRSKENDTAPSATSCKSNRQNKNNFMTQHEINKRLKELYHKFEISAIERDSK